jgi:hypothetical protein
MTSKTATTTEHYYFYQQANKSGIISCQTFPGQNTHYSRFQIVGVIASTTGSL